MRVRSAMLRHVLTACSLIVFVSANDLTEKLTTLAATAVDPWSPVIGDTEGLPEVTPAPLNISSLSGRRAANLVENIRRKLMHDNYDYSNEESLSNTTGMNKEPVSKPLETMATKANTSIQKHMSFRNNDKSSQQPQITKMQVAKVNMPIYSKTPFQLPTITPVVDVDSSIKSDELLAKDLIYYMDENKLRRSNQNMSKIAQMSNTHKINKHVSANNTINNEIYKAGNHHIAKDEKIGGRRQYKYRQQRMKHDIPSTTTFDGVYRASIKKQPDKEEEIQDNSNYYANLIVPSTKRSRSYRRHKRRKQRHKMRSGHKRRAEKYIEPEYETDESPNYEDDQPINQQLNNRQSNNYVIHDFYRRNAHNKVLRPNNNAKENSNDFTDTRIVQQSTQEVSVRNDSEHEQSTTSKVKYKLIKVKSRDGFRRASGGERQFLQERGPEGVALIALDGGPFPQFRLPRGRRQYMLEDLDPRPPLVEQLPKTT